jgi:SAM-dependent methyltransferase
MTAIPALFDRALYVRRLARARTAGPDILNRTLAAELAERASLVTRQFRQALVIAPDPEAVAAALQATGRITVSRAQTPSAGDDLALGAESFDAIFHAADLHAVNDVPGTLAQLRRALKPDGLLLACLFAGETLTELRQSFLAADLATTGGATPRVAPMIGVRELGALLQRAGFALPVADLDRTIVRYADAIALIHELSALGMSNMLSDRSRRPMSRRSLAAAASHYHSHFADADGRIRATLELAWATAWAPHESQPKPLKPGSARMRLADALNATGEKP